MQQVEEKLFVRLTSNMASNMIEEPKLSYACENLFDTFQGVIPFDRIGIALLSTEADEQYATLKWAKSTNQAASSCLKLGYKAPLSGSGLKKIIETGKARIINDLDEYLIRNPTSASTPLVLKDGILSSLTCPLKGKKGWIGFVFFSSYKVNTYRESHIEVFQLIASQLGFLLEIIQLDESLQSAKDKESFFYKCLHDLSNQLNIASCYSQLILQGAYKDSEDKLKKAQENLDKQLTSALSLFSELQNFRDAVAPDFLVHKNEVDLNDFLRSFEAAASVLSKKKAIHFEILRDPNLPSLLKMDGKRISQVLNNLLSNAIKFSKSGTRILLSIYNENDEIRFMVQDQGQGIPASEIEGVFQNPKLLTTLSTAHEQSSGLGLLICKRIIEDHGGKIGVESIWGKGSTFTFTVPKEQCESKSHLPVITFPRAANSDSCFH